MESKLWPSFVYQNVIVPLVLRPRGLITLGKNTAEKRMFRSLEFRSLEEYYVSGKSTEGPALFWEKKKKKSQKQEKLAGQAKQSRQD